MISDAHPIIRILTRCFVTFDSKDSHYTFEKLVIIINAKSSINIRWTEKRLTQQHQQLLENRPKRKRKIFLAKRAHSIRDKVHEFTDDVKEKTHNLTHSSESKKNKKENIQKPTGATSKSSPNPRTVSAKGPNSSSDDDDDTTKPAPSPTAPAGILIKPIF